MNVTKFHVEEVFLRIRAQAPKMAAWYVRTYHHHLLHVYVAFLPLSGLLTVHFSGAIFLLPTPPLLHTTRNTICSVDCGREVYKEEVLAKKERERVKRLPKNTVTTTWSFTFAVSNGFPPVHPSYLQVVSCRCCKKTMVRYINLNLQEIERTPIGVTLRLHLSWVFLSFFH